jgi:hypothetical protein
VRLSDFTHVATLFLNTGQYNSLSAALDAGGLLYIGSENGMVSRIDLADFSTTTVLILPNGARTIYAAAIDTGGGFLPGNRRLVQPEPWPGCQGAPLRFQRGRHAAAHRL